MVIFFVFLNTEFLEIPPFNKQYTESQLRAGAGYILEDFNEAQVRHFFHAATLNGDDKSLLFALRRTPSLESVDKVTRSLSSIGIVRKLLHEINFL